MDEFAAALSTFENVILLDIYPARELPIEGVTSAKLLEQITSKEKQLVAKEELITHLKASDAEIILTIGAGDIGEMVQEIKIALEGK